MNFFEIHFADDEVEVPPCEGSANPDRGQISGENREISGCLWSLFTGFDFLPAK
jgi:hypothetical protein